MDQTTYLLINVFILSLIPSFEGRYAIIVGYALGLHPLASYAISCFAIALLSLILPSVLPLIDDIARWMSRSRYTVIRRISELYMMYVERARAEAKPYVERYGLLGLALFVATLTGNRGLDG